MVGLLAGDRVYMMNSGVLPETATVWHVSWVVEVP